MAAYEQIRLLSLHIQQAARGTEMYLPNSLLGGGKAALGHKCPHILENSKIFVGHFVLDSVLRTEGSILDPSYEIRN